LPHVTEISLFCAAFVAAYTYGEPAVRRVLRLHRHAMLRRRLRRPPAAVGSGDREPR
jgi:hypothetical protein